LVLSVKKILVVDDSKLMHRMFDVMLRSYSLVSAFDGREALERLREHTDVDLVLLDINMPVMSGLEFLEAVSREDGLRDIPVVIISTEGKEEDTQRGLEAGAVAYIRKPFHSEELRQVIDQLKVGRG
jgi:two-component system chemotaxis response regulator CheY